MAEEKLLVRIFLRLFAINRSEMENSMDNNFTENIDEFKETLSEIQKSWEDICEAFGVDKEKIIESAELKRNIRTTVMELDEIKNLEYVKKSGKQLENLSENYILSMIRFAYSVMENEENAIWSDTINDYVNEIFTEEVIALTDDLKEQCKNVVMDNLFSDIQRIFSISNQLNVIRIMETKRDNSDVFMALEDNFIYFGISFVQKCNGNAVIMAQVVTFLKVLIKMNDNILKSISSMLQR